MTLGLCLLALAATARSGGVIAAQHPQKGKPAAPKKIEFPPAKPAQPPAKSPPQRFRNLALTLSQRVDALVDALTPEERQLFLCTSQKAVDRLGIAAFDWSDRTPDSRFPRPIGIAASFDLDLAGRIADVRARDAHGRALFSPIDVLGDPRWGAASDCFGEDPLLVGSMAATQVSEVRRLKGVGEIGEMGRPARSTDPEGPSEVELAAHGFDEHFLSPSRRAVAANPAVGLWIDPFTRVSGARVIDAKFLESTVRKEWGLTGPVISNGLGDSVGAISDPAHPSKEVSNKGAAVSALLDGYDLFADGDCKLLVEAAKSNPDMAKAMDRAVRRVLETEMRAGMFDPPPLNPKPLIDPARAKAEVEQAQARAGAESMVLLKNQDDLLPLKPGYRTIAVIGPNADNPSAMLGAAPATEKDGGAKPVTPLAAIRAAMGDKTKVLFEKGTGLLGREDLQTIPADAFPSGVNAEYYDSANFAGTPVTKAEDHLDVTWKGAPVEGIKATGFSVKWTGALVPKVTGKYGLGFTVDGAARLYLDDQLIIDDWNDAPTRTKMVPVDLNTDRPGFYVIRVEYARGARAGSGSVRLLWNPPEEAPYRAAIEAAIKSDLVVLILGLDSSLEGAGRDRHDLGLPDAQEGLLEQIAALKRPTVLILLNGGPVSSPFAKQQIPAILEAWYPGEAGGTAIADVLTGAASPSGKLPVSFYQSNSQIPDPTAVDAGRGYRNSVFRPLFAFGSGLTYTQFAYSALAAPSFVDGSKPVTVGVTVKNVGKRAGEEVVQLYVSRDKPSADVPRIALRGFRRVHLNAGESRRVVFVLSVKEFGGAHAEPGQVRVSVGGNQPMDGLPATVSATVRVR